MINLSILVPTLGSRRVFWPWLGWQIAKQRGLSPRETEVIIAADVPTALEFRTRFAAYDIAPDDIGAMAVREIICRPDEPVGVKRNRLLAAAAGRLAAWFDDDDWHTDTRLSLCVPWAEARQPVAYGGLAYLDLAREEVFDVAHMRARGVPVTVVGRTEILRSVPFDDRKHGSDTRWFAELQRTAVIDTWARDPLPGFLALRHDQNLTPLGRGHRGIPLARLAHVGREFADTEYPALVAALASLRMRQACAPAPPMPF